MWISSSPPASSICVNALMSAPAENTSEPGIPEYTTIAPTLPSELSRSQTVFRSLITWGETAFIGGFASQAIATSPRVSTLIVSVWSPSSGCG